MGLRKNFPRENAVHAPIPPLDGILPNVQNEKIYCHSSAIGKIARKPASKNYDPVASTVTCLACLNKLSRAVQYANWLRGQGIGMGVEWKP